MSADKPWVISEPVSECIESLRPEEKRKEQCGGE